MYKRSFSLVGIFALLTLFALAAAQPSIDAVKGYLLTGVTAQLKGTAALKAAAQRYYALAQAEDFDYQALAKSRAAEVRAALQDARSGWTTASPEYEAVEGIVAGVDVLSGFDTDIDGGVSAAEGGDNVVTYDLTTPDGRVFKKPGPLYSVTERTLWGTVKDYSSGVAFNVDDDGIIGFGDVLPDANVLKAGADLLDEKTHELYAAAKSWQPSTKDVFGALIVNVPTTADTFIARWQESRFVLGNASSETDMVAISSLSDLSNNISSWQTLYQGVAEQVSAESPTLDQQIITGLQALKTWVDNLYAQENQRHFTPEQAELIYSEGNNRASAITGKIVQAAALLGIQTD